MGIPHLVDYRVGPAGIARTLRNSLLLQGELALRVLPLTKVFQNQGFNCQGLESRLANSITGLSNKQGCVAIEADDGCGGDVLARWLHGVRQREGLFFELDASVLQEEELTGLLLGSLETGPGYLERARGGSLLIRNIHQIPSSLQVLLWSCIQNREFRLPGATSVVPLDVEIFSLTKVVLADQVAMGHFHRGLAISLGEGAIRIPSFRERSDEIPAMAAAWFAGKNQRCGLAPETYKAIREYSWPGNAWELMKILETSGEKAGFEGTVQPSHLPNQIRLKGPTKEDLDPLYLLPRLNPRAPIPPLKKFRTQAGRQAERAYLLKVMGEASGKITEARTIAGVSKSSFYALLAKHGIHVPK